MCRLSRKGIFINTHLGVGFARLLRRNDNNQWAAICLPSCSVYRGDPERKPTNLKGTRICIQFEFSLLWKQTSTQRTRKTTKGKEKRWAIYNC